MKPILRGIGVCVLLLLFSGSAFAGDIFVYKGTLRWRGTLELANSPLTAPSMGVYTVIDFDTGQIRFIQFFTKEGTKRRAGGGTSVYNVTRFTLANGKIGTAVANGNNESLPTGEFQAAAVVFQGTDVSLKVETTPAIRFDSRPRLLVGRVASAGAANGGFFRFGDYNLALQPALTIAANDNNKTFETVVDELIAAVEAKGYKVPM